jgi:hypothetical protein
MVRVRLVLSGCGHRYGYPQKSSRGNGYLNWNVPDQSEVPQQRKKRRIFQEEGIMWKVRDSVQISFTNVQHGLQCSGGVLFLEI